ncbi:hypothetical protein GCN74_20785 [Janthinobacterium sp. FT14W]|nr:hypothetical protein GCN74_20785 [Janthinobacterium sp. FT14W]
MQAAHQLVQEGAQRLAHVAAATRAAGAVRGAVAGVDRYADRRQGAGNGVEKRAIVGLLRPRAAGIAGAAGAAGAADAAAA